MNFLITAIGTDCGKTIASAIFCEMLRADYWKPVQAGLPTDTSTVQQLITNPITKFHKESFLLELAMSPHAAAQREKKTISLTDILLPESANPIIVEGAGGCLVPLNDDEFVVDLATHLNLEVILVSNIYLGSINHTLLTLEALKARKLPPKAIVFNGESNRETENIILKHCGPIQVLRINKEPSITKETVRHYANEWRKEWM